MIKNKIKYKFIFIFYYIKSILCKLMFQGIPIKNDYVLLWSYSGKNYSCNPKAITDYILKNNNDDFKLIWALNRDIREKIYIPKNVQVVTYNSIKYFYYLYVSKFIITNSRTEIFFKKRKHQYYIQTWHSSLGLKKIEKDAENTLHRTYIKQAKHDSAKCDLLISGCDKRTEIFEKCFYYQGEILKSGTPRNDIFFDVKNTKNKIKKVLNIDLNTKIILYAPTFRNDYSISNFQFDFEKVKLAFEKKLNEKCILIIKMHPNYINLVNYNLNCDDIIDVTNYPDMQELLIVSDILITDYSSSMFDYSLLNKPCFLYTPDLEDYIKSDRGIYFDIMSLPFDCAVTENDLIRCIEEFDIRKYKHKNMLFQSEIGSYETGNASFHIVERMKKVREDGY